MVTILQVVPRLDAGGSELATVEIAAALSRAGARAIVVSEGGRLAPDLAEAGGELVTLPVASKSPLTMLRNVRRLADLIEAEKVDLIHARSRAPAWSAFIAARQTRTAFVTTYHGAYGETDPFKRGYNSVMAKGERVIANSHFTASVIADRHAGARDRIRVIYRGIEPDLFNQAALPADAAARLRAKWGVAPDAKIVLHAARLTGIKGQRDLIAAIAELDADGAFENAVAILAGDGREDYRLELIDLIAHHGLEEKVKLVGHCAEMPAAYLASHVAVTTSTVPETFGRTSAEAQAMGCPVVVPDLGALPETIVSPRQDRAGFTGWLVPSRSIEQLASSLRHALQLSREERAAIGARARDFVTPKFSLSQMQEATLSVYDELLGTDLAGRFRGA